VAAKPDDAEDITCLFGKSWKYTALTGFFFPSHSGLSTVGLRRRHFGSYHRRPEALARPNATMSAKGFMPHLTPKLQLMKKSPDRRMAGLAFRSNERPKINFRESPTGKCW
jgi:hypothetical protein